MIDCIKHDKYFDERSMTKRMTKRNDIALVRHYGDIVGMSVGPAVGKLDGQTMRLIDGIPLGGRDLLSLRKLDGKIVELPEGQPMENQKM